ncbi:hypothetical protein ACRZ5S_18100 [Vibrio scophthalmi]|uniref:hypothetical protein n=1 Tax=Vibrio scophthalmi TaxID=45658 RepID=UPI003EB81B1E
MLYHYQTLIAGVVGFLGVIISIVANGYFARKQERDLRAHAKSSVIAALRSELRVNFETIKVRSAQLHKDHDETKNGFLPLVVFNEVYKHSLAQLGVLDEEQAEYIIKVYLLLEELPTKMALLPGVKIIDNSFIQFTSAEQKKYAAKEHQIIAVLLGETLEKIA